jgi:2-phosphosulfolactate phosphatase
VSNAVLVDVAFLPRDVVAPAEQCCVVVDVLRASTMLATLFARGCPAVYVARTLDQGRAFARARGFLLCGERGGARPPGFDLGNSPTELEGKHVADRPAVLCTTNGTVALHAVAAAPAVFVGSLSNAAAVAADALEAARDPGRLTIVCAGREGRFAYDDAWTAGRLVARAVALSGGSADLTDAAQAALALTQAVPDALDALRRSRSAQALLPLGLESDIAFAAQEDRFALAPRLVSEASGAPWTVLLVPEG